jgi:iron complex outermembrane receptor protein
MLFFRGKFKTEVEMFKKTILFKGISLALGAAVTISAYAEDRVMEEVVVTATKRQQTLQEVPVAVTVTSGETIERARILDIIDLQSVVPSLRVPQFQSSTQVNFLIRGFGNGANNPGIEPSVGVFIDGVYRSRSAAQLADLTNIERIEVLRGPQSTLFGKNASAGVISVVTQGPEFEWNGNVEVTAGNYGAIQTKGYVTGPLSENAAFSVGGSYNEREGYANNLALGTEVNDRDRWSLNGQFLFQPSDSMEFKLSIDYSEIDEVCCTAANLVSGPTAAAIPLFGGQLDNENPFSYDIYQNKDPREAVDNGGISLHSDFEFDNFSITSITAYRELDRNNLSEDVDYSSADLISDHDNIFSNFETFTQEIRISSNSDGAVHWLAGLYYFDEAIETEGGIKFGEFFGAYADVLTGAPGTLPFVEGLFGFPAGTFQAPGTGVVEFATQDDTAYSLFGTIDWEVTDRLVLTLGLNYTNDEKDISLRQVNTDVFSKLALPPSLAGLSAFQFLPELLNFPNAAEDGKSNDSNTDYTIRVAYEIGDNLNAYASWATGFKSTSWNLSRDSRPTTAELAVLTAAGATLPNNLTTGTRLAAPEEAEVFEIGLKGQYDSFSFAVTIFDQTLNDFQTNAFTGTGFSLTNAGETNVKGLEIETTYFATDNLTLTFAGTFLDPVYESYPLSTSGDLSGETVAGINEESISISANWDWESGEYTGFVRADYQYESEVQILDSPIATAALAAVGSSTRKSNLLSASVGVSRGNYDLTLWGRNLTENEFLITAFPSVAQAGSFSGYPNQPRTYGLTLRAHLN